MLGLYFCAELASSTRDLKEKGGEIRRQKIKGGRSHIVYIGHNPHVIGYIFFAEVFVVLVVGTELVAKHFHAKSHFWFNDIISILNHHI